MEEFEKDITEKEITPEETQSPAEAEAETPKTAQIYESSSSDNAAEESVSAELPVTAEPRELASEESYHEPNVFRWNYGEQKDFIEKETRTKHKNGAVIYAVVMTCAFVVAFALLITLLIVNGISKSDGDGAYIPPASNGETSDRVVYVREHDDESGVLTTQEIYDKCLPATVTVAVAKNSAAGIGSGFIIAADGYIVTANHVVEGATSVSVILNNGQKYAATVVDGNAFTDLALIKIEATGLPTIAIGKSSDLLVGDHVVSIGTPAAIDFAGSLSDGTVSYNNRIFKIRDDNGGVEKKMILIQTNALVNPGNSGGPLINEYGEVVGIVTMKLKSSYYEGMCFAIPTDSAMPIIYAMKNGENYDSLLSAVSQYPASLGIAAENATTESKVPGVKITAIVSNEYDISQKMKVGDIIVSIDKVNVTSITDMNYLLDRYSHGDTVEITFYRNTQMLTVNVVLGK